MLAEDARSAALVIIISYPTCARLVFTSEGVGVVIRSVELMI